MASTFADAEAVETFPAWSVTLIWTVCTSIQERRCGGLPGAPVHGILRRCDARSGIRGRDRDADAGGIPARQPGRAGEYRRADDRRSVVDVDRLADVRDIAGVVGYAPLNGVDTILRKGQAGNPGTAVQRNHLAGDTRCGVCPNSRYGHGGNIPAVVPIRRGRLEAGRRRSDIQFDRFGCTGGISSFVLGLHLDRISTIGRERDGGLPVCPIQRDALAGYSGSDIRRVGRDGHRRDIPAIVSIRRSRGQGCVRNGWGVIDRDGSEDIGCVPGIVRDASMHGVDPIHRQCQRRRPGHSIQRNHLAGDAGTRVRPADGDGHRRQIPAVLPIRRRQHEAGSWRGCIQADRLG